MIQKLLTILHDIYKHFIIYSLRTAFLQVVITIGGSYLLSWLFRGILVSSGYPGLSLDNVVSFFLNPLTFSLLMLYLFVLAFLIFLEFSFLVEMLRYKETPLELEFKRFKADFKNFLFSIRGSHFFSFLAYLILTIPVLRFFFSSALLERLYIPSFITGELEKSNMGHLGLVIGFAIVFYLNLRLIYTLPLTIIEQKTHFTEHLKTSWRMTAGRSLLTLLGLAMISATITLVSFSLSGFILAILSFVFSSPNDKQWLVQIILLSLVWLIIFAASLLIKLASISYLVLNIETEHTQIVQVNPSSKRKKSRWLRLVILNSAIAIGAFLYHANLLSNGKPDQIAIIAHRGFVNKAVENSIEGLQASKKAKVNMVEVDVLMTKDKQFVVVHDDHLKRLSKRAITVSQSKASDIIGLTLHQHGHTSQLVSFKTFLAEANRLKMPLLIDLKTSKGQEDYAPLFLKELDSLSLSQGSQIMSLDLDLIESIEKKRPDLTTGHVITFQFGDFASNHVDFYAIEEFSYTNHIAKLAHDRQKKLYIWTINDQDKLKTYLQSAVDGIITDYPTKARLKQNDLVTNQDFFSLLTRLLDLD